MSASEKALVFAFIDERIKNEKKEEKKMERMRPSGSSAGRRVPMRRRR